MRYMDIAAAEVDDEEDMDEEDEDFVSSTQGLFSIDLCCAEVLITVSGDDKLMNDDDDSSELTGL